jgi:hypothetical protein
MLYCALSLMRSRDNLERLLPPLQQTLCFETSKHCAHLWMVMCHCCRPCFREIWPLNALPASLWHASLRVSQRASSGVTSRSSVAYRMLTCRRITASRLSGALGLSLSRPQILWRKSWRASTGKGDLRSVMAEICIVCPWLVVQMCRHWLCSMHTESKFGHSSDMYVSEIEFESSREGC